MLSSMERNRGITMAAAAVVVSIAWFMAMNPVPTSAAPIQGTALNEATALMNVAMADDQPMERQIGGFTKTVYREIRRSFRLLAWMFWRSVDRWGRWIKLSAFSIGVAIIAALADGGLVNAWRAEGFRSLLTHSVLMLYVYAGLLFSSGVHLAPKLLLLAALIYGIVRRDLLPDRTLIPGRLDDIILIVVATRTFVYACPEELIAKFADRAVNLKQRVVSFSRARTR